MKWVSLLLSLLFLRLASSKAEQVVQSFLPPAATATAAGTIPAFPEQSDEAGCPLDLPTDLFKNVKSACTGKHFKPTTCCPVLAAWLYSAYSATALGKTIKQPASYYDLPLLPNDSETCIDSLESRLKSNGVELRRVNESCDVVYCECGVRLHHLACSEAFSVNSDGDLVGNHVVQKLEKDCLSNGLHACSRCFKTLHLLNKGNTSKPAERSSKLHNEDCELMGLTWLLAKNRSAYIHTVSAVLRAKMMNTNGNSACTLNTDGMPLAVDSSEISSSSSFTLLPSSLALCFLLFLMLTVTLHQPFDSI
ncbi:hypothetical protein QVD17_26871 [Tagetes erecta]|uniref:SPARK domain-containing protein n=1 Tax=Tagetes erecta TaxID=13708 RepID=A0AAD8NQQ2_TARER|nr:hypothetical protein QVD17_26871 [Tagetes erecta]